MTTSRLAALVLSLTVLALADIAPARAAWDPHDWTAGGPQYSPLHFWAPSVYRWRAWLCPHTVQDYPGYKSPDPAARRAPRRSLFGH